MSVASDDTKDSSTLDQALRLGSMGYKIVPLPPGEKYPKGLRKWQEEATDDEATIIEWWGTGEAGIGWAMGLQPNNANLVAIDVDVANGKPGAKSLRELVEREPRMAQVMKNTVVSVTGSGGRHIVVSVEPDFEVRNGKMADGIDIRGEGGFIVIPPSVHPNGESYQWVDGKSPFDRAPVRVDGDLADRLFGTRETPARERGSLPTLSVEGTMNPVIQSGFGNDPTPADWARANHRIGDLLVEAGWTYMNTKGEHHYWCRPGKNPRDGHSAIVHGEAPMVVFSTEAPPAFWQVGRENADGSKSLSPLDVFAAVRYGGDVSAASRELRREMPQPRRADGGAVAPVREPDGGEDVGEAPTHLNLPQEFWAVHPKLTHIRTAAHSRMTSPDAVLMGVLARVSALIPPSLQLPAIVGSAATFDFVGTVVAASSGGKTISNNVAKDLLPSPRTDILFDLPVGSGEGLIQSFFVPEVDDEGKPTGKQVVGIPAIHFTVDEGTALMEQSSRRGTTIVQTLCSAWSGATLGQANASAETRRIIEARRVRVAAVVNMQTRNGHLLLDDRLIAVGFPQRLAFAWAHSPLPPVEELPDWPGPMTFEVPPTLHTPHALSVHESIVNEVRGLRYQVATGSRVLDELDGHQQLLRLKIAGILTILFDGDEVTPFEWELAGTIVSFSRSVRNVLTEAKRADDARRLSSQVAVQATREVAIEEAKEQKAVEALASRIAERVSPGGEASAALRRRICSSKTRHRYEAALELAVRRGDVRIEDVDGTGQAGLWVHPK